jgi:hypothetical protein
VAVDPKSSWRYIDGEQHLHVHVHLNTGAVGRGLTKNALLVFGLLKNPSTEVFHRAQNATPKVLLGHEQVFMAHCSSGTRVRSCSAVLHDKWLVTICHEAHPPVLGPLALMLVQRTRHMRSRHGWHTVVRNAGPLTQHFGPVRHIGGIIETSMAKVTPDYGSVRSTRGVTPIEEVCTSASMNISESLRPSCGQLYRYSHPFYGHGNLVIARLLEKQRIWWRQL